MKVYNPLSVPNCPLWSIVLLSFIVSLHTEAGGSNTTVIVVVVIIVIILLTASSVFLAWKYNAKSPEVTPSTGRQMSGAQAKKKKRKNKHSSSTTGMGEGPGIVKMGEIQGDEKKKGRRKRSSSSPKVRVRSQI